MSVSYAFRLVCICMVSFFLVHAVFGAAISSVAPLLIRWAERLSARRAARVLLYARLFPSALAGFLVIALFVPSFLWGEEEAGAEQIGFTFLAMAALGAAIWVASIHRTLRATSSATRCRSVLRHPGVWVVDTERPFLSLSGVFRSRIIVSRSVVQSLTREELAAAFRHERAHRVSHDNLKRLLILMAPGLLPFHRGFRELERAWARFTERAADDRAVAGNARRSLSLAAALVRVARMGGAPVHPAGSSLLADGQELSARVNRLLSGTAEREISRRSSSTLYAAVVASSGAAFGAVLRPATLEFVHGLLEGLVH